MRREVAVAASQASVFAASFSFNRPQFLRMGTDVRQKVTSSLLATCGKAPGAPVLALFGPAGATLELWVNTVHAA